MRMQERIAIAIHCITPSITDRLGYQQIISGTILLRSDPCVGHPVLGRQHFPCYQTIRKTRGKRKGLAVVSIAGVAILIRFALLGLVAVSPPITHGEFSP
jgi:hypothetical protein